MSERTSGATSVEEPAPRREAPAHAGARQLAVDVAAHGIADRLDILRDRMLAVFTQASGIGSKRGKRRLEAMGEIGGAAARTLDLALLGIEQRIDLLDERLDLDAAPPPADDGCARPGYRRRRGAAASSGRRPRPTWIEVATASTRASRRERKREILGEGGGGRRHAREIGGTATRTGTRRSPMVRLTARSATSMRAPPGPCASWRCTSPGAGSSTGSGNVVSHSERERSELAAIVARPASTGPTADRRSADRPAAA